jgi:hypothetical protein
MLRAIEMRRMSESRAMQDEIKFHTDRAMAELALAAGSSDLTAARAHLRLSELHLQRMRALSGAPAPLMANG